MYLLLLGLQAASGASLPGPFCLPQVEASLAGVQLGMSGDSVVRRLGRPPHRRAASGEDDGGTFPIQVLVYRDLEVEVGRGHVVQRITTTSPRVHSPAGVHVGQTIAEVAARLAAPDTVIDLIRVSWAPPLCEDGPLDVAVGVAEVRYEWGPVSGPFDPTRPPPMSRQLVRLVLEAYGP